MSIDKSEIHFGLTEISYDAAQMLGGLLVEACGEVEDGYTEMAAWTQCLEFKDGQEDALHAVYKRYLGFPEDAINASIAYKLVQELAEGKVVLAPAVVLRAQVPSKEVEGFTDFIVTKKLGEDFPDDDGWSHQYLLTALRDSKQEK